MRGGLGELAPLFNIFSYMNLKANAVSKVNQSVTLVVFFCSVLATNTEILPPKSS